MKIDAKQSLNLNFFTYFSMFMFVASHVLFYCHYSSTEMLPYSSSVSQARSNFLIIASIGIPVGWVLAQGFVRLFYHLDLGALTCGLEYHFDNEDERVSGEIVVKDKEGVELLPKEVNQGEEEYARNEEERERSYEIDILKEKDVHMKGEDQEIDFMAKNENLFEVEDMTEENERSQNAAAHTENGEEMKIQFSTKQKISFDVRKKE